MRKIRDWIMSTTFHHQHDKTASRINLYFRFYDTATMPSDHHVVYKH